MMRNLLLFFLAFSAMPIYAQIGIGTANPQGVFNIDGAKDNPKTGTPTTAQLANDVIIDNTGKIGVGMLLDAADNSKLQVDGNITIEGVGIQTSNPQGIFNLDGAKDNPKTGTPTTAQLANDVIIDNTGKIGVGMLPDAADNSKLQVDGNITIEGVGIQTSNPQGIFNLDGAKDNPKTGTPTTAQLANDVIIDNTGKIGIGMLPDTADNSKLQVDGNITIEGVGIQTSNPQGIFNLDGAKDNPKTGTPTTAQLANDVIIDNTGKIGVGMLPDTADNSKLQVDGTITIKGDGTPGYEPGSGKILASDANGRGYWAKNITVTPPVVGKLNNGTSESINTQGPITGAYIDLPEGRWIVITNILLITINSPGGSASANNNIQALWTRLTFGDKLDGSSTKGWCPLTGITGAGGQVNGNLYCIPNANIAGLPTADIEAGPYVSGTMVYPINFGMANGTTIISHTCSKYNPSINLNGACTGIDPITSEPFKRYYLTVASSMSYNGFNTNWNTLAAKNWSENGIVAFPVALDSPIVVP